VARAVGRGGRKGSVVAALTAGEARDSTRRTQAVYRPDVGVFFLPGLPGLEGPDLPGALCSQADPEAWFPVKGGSAELARSICARCPERAPCLAWALETGEQFGVWGGTTARERRQLLARRGAERAA
jgi:WhiB family redox-sensing transcriptional regulator